MLVKVQAENVTNQAGTAPSEIDIPLSGDHTGAMTFDWQWQHRALTDQFGGELRTFHGDDVSSATTIRYPLFLPAPDPGPRPGTTSPSASPPTRWHLVGRTDTAGAVGDATRRLQPTQLLSG